jgi:hypothetical protein
MHVPNVPPVSTEFSIAAAGHCCCFFCLLADAIRVDSSTCPRRSNPQGAVGKNSAAAKK